MSKKIGEIYESFGTFVLCTGNSQLGFWIGEVFQGVVVQTYEKSDTFVGEYSESWSSNQFVETNKVIELKEQK